MTTTQGGRRVLIVGAGRNIGRAVAERFAAIGDIVALNARTQEQIEAAASDIRAQGGRAMPFAGDISDEADVATVVTAAESWAEGTIDVLIHCATVRMYRRIVDSSVDEWHVPLRVGLDGAFLSCRAVLPGMAEQGWGRIILMTGLRGYTGNPGLSAVAATKAGMGGLMKALAHEYAGTGVTVNAVSPGRIDTTREGDAIGDTSGAERHDRTRTTGIPMGRLGDPVEVAAACEYLASDGAAFTTGQTLHVNGGILMP